MISAKLIYPRFINYLLQCFQFSVSATISSIQTDPFNLQIGRLKVPAHLYCHFFFFIWTEVVVFGDQKIGLIKSTFWTIILNKIKFHNQHFTFTYTWSKVLEKYFSIYFIFLYHQILVNHTKRKLR